MSIFSFVFAKLLSHFEIVVFAAKSGWMCDKETSNYLITAIRLTVFQIYAKRIWYDEQFSAADCIFHSFNYAAISSETGVRGQGIILDRFTCD